MPKRELMTGRFEASVLFCDIRGFTALFDQRDPLEALTFANSVLGELGSTVEACNGKIDKFTGDGFLAYFGIGDHDLNQHHADDACWCAVRLREALETINSQRYIDDQMTVTIGIGIHTGLVAAGIIHAMTKKEYTILGTTVNIAARIEALTKFFSVDCLVSDSTVSKLKTDFMLKTMPPQPLRGIESTIGTSWLLPMNQSFA